MSAAEDLTRNQSGAARNLGGARSAASVLESGSILDLENHAEACRRAFIRRMAEVGDRIDTIINRDPSGPSVTYGALLEIMRNELDREIERLIASGQYLPW